MSRSGLTYIRWDRGWVTVSSTDMRLLEWLQRQVQTFVPMCKSKIDAQKFGDPQRLGETYW